MGAMQRRKGANGEREVVQILMANGFPAQRTAPLQAAQGSTDSDVLGIEGHALEIKRCERVEIDKWCAQIELASKPTDVPCVVWRRSRQPWRIAMPFDDFLALVKAANL